MTLSARVRASLGVSSLVLLGAAGVLAACGGSGARSSTDAGPHEGGPGSRDGGAPDTGHTRDASRDAPPGKPDSGNVTDAEVAACTASASARCGAQAQCNLPLLSSLYGDAGACIARTRASCEVGLHAPGALGTAATVQACAAALSQETCAAELNLDTPDACVRGGAGQVGSPCAVDAQCQSDFCAVRLGEACGTCAPLPAPGASCKTLTACGQSLTCVKGTCVKYVSATGGGCSATLPCGAGLSCVIPGGDGGTGTCMPTSNAVGAPCDPKMQTAAGCDPARGLYCVGVSTSPAYETCQPTVSATAGMPCDGPGVSGVACVGSSLCYRRPDAGSVCVGRALDNAPCNTITGPPCEPPARCVGALGDGGTIGACVLPDPSACR